MSPSWRERILVALAPGALAFARNGGAQTGNRSADRAATDGAEPWRGAVSALAAFVDSLKDERVDLTVVLSNHFARYLLVPIDPGLETDGEALAYARFCFARIHGERSQSWQVRLDRDGRGPARVASAVDEALPQAILGCFGAGSSARLVSVQPYLMAAFNQWRRPLAAAGASLLLVEPDRACVAYLENGMFSSLHSARGNFGGAAEWAGFLERGRHLASRSIASTRVLVHAPATADAETSAHVGDWRFEPVAQARGAGAASPSDPYLAMALCAS